MASAGFLACTPDDGDNHSGTGGAGGGDGAPTTTSGTATSTSTGGEVCDGEQPDPECGCFGWEEVYHCQCEIGGTPVEVTCRNFDCELLPEYPDTHACEVEGEGGMGPCTTIEIIKECGP